MMDRASAAVTDSIFCLNLIDEMMMVEHDDDDDYDEYDDNEYG
jgi:hypothetical protein